MGQRVFVIDSLLMAAGETKLHWRAEGQGKLLVFQGFPDALVLDAGIHLNALDAVSDIDLPVMYFPELVIHAAKTLSHGSLYAVDLATKIVILSAWAVIIHHLMVDCLGSFRQVTELFRAQPE